MKASAMLRRGRGRAGLSQRELARRTRVPQSSISRIERGVISPSADTLARLLRVCGLELEAMERPGRGLDRTLIRERLRMTPGERVRRAVREWRATAPFRRRASAAGRRPA